MEQRHTPGRQRIILCSLIFLLGLGVGTVLGGTGETPRKGGTLRVGVFQEPMSPDAHRATGPLQLFVGPYLESLYTQGLDYGWIPMLAEGHTVSDDGLVYTFKLRRGVPFHHGKELTAADAVASLLRWGKITLGGKRLFQRVESVKALDHYTIQLRLQQQTALVLPFLGAAMIYPKEVLEEAGEGQVRTHIGTGPFKLAELHPGRHIKYVRFERYQARPEPPNGYGGRKTPWLDTLLYIYIPDDSARMAALEAGEVDFTYFRAEAHDRLKAHPDLRVQMVEGMKVRTQLNKQKGLFTNVKLRQAALAALDMEPILRTAIGHPPFYRLDSSLSFKEQPWWTDAGGELYNQKDLERARRLLQEASYQGEPLRYMVAQDVAPLHRLALATKPQLEGVGFTVELQRVDMHTLRQRLNNPDLWDAFTIDSSIPPDPALTPGLSCAAPGGIVTETFCSCCRRWRRSRSSSGAIGSGRTSTGSSGTGCPLSSTATCSG